MGSRCTLLCLLLGASGLDISPIAELRLETQQSMFPFWPDNFVWAVVWPHQNVTAAALVFCEDHHRFDEACVPTIAGHLTSLLEGECSNSLNDGKSSVCSYNSDERWTRQAANPSEVRASQRIAAEKDPGSILLLNAQLAVATALLRVEAPRLLVLWVSIN